MPIKPIKKHRNLFISSEGYVFKIHQGREVELPTKWGSNNSKLFVIIENKEYELIYLMIEYFIGDLKETDRMRFKINNLNRIPLSSIIITPLFKNSSELTCDDYNKIKLFGCDTKAYGANARCIDKITELEVYVSLKTYEFKCIYCAEKLKPNKWHLDHYHPTSKSGKNRFENLVPSCDRCNLMKGALLPNEFIYMCRKIVNSSLIKNIIEEMTEGNAN